MSPPGCLTAPDAEGSSDCFLGYFADTALGDATVGSWILTLTAFEARLDGGPGGPTGVVHGTLRAHVVGQVSGTEPEAGFDFADASWLGSGTLFLRF
jgi:hypothetical protein